MTTTTTRSKFIYLCWRSHWTSAFTSTREQKGKEMNADIYGISFCAHIFSWMDAHIFLILPPPLFLMDDDIAFLQLFFSMWQKCAIDFVNCKHSENVFFSSSLMIASDWTYNKSDIIILNRIILCCEYIVAISNSVLFRSQMNGMRFHDALFQFQIIKWQ